jgi:hypothetical protein
MNKPIIYGSEIIDFILSKTQIKSTMLAALLGITDRTLANWRHVQFDDIQMVNKIHRLWCFYLIVNEFVLNNVSGDSIIALLDEPIYPDNEDLTLMYLMNNDPHNPIVRLAVKSIAEGLSKPKQ